MFEYMLSIFCTGRSPYGERGLKYNVLRLCAVYAMSLSLRRAWIEIPTSRLPQTGPTVALLTESVD